METEQVQEDREESESAEREEMEGQKDLEELGLMETAQAQEETGDSKMAEREEMEGQKDLGADREREQTAEVGKKKVVATNGGKLCDYLVFLKDMELDSAMPQLYKLFSLVATIGATSPGVERRFSCLKRLKSYTRNTMGQGRLSSLALLAIERTLVKSLEKTPSCTVQSLVPAPMGDGSVVYFFLPHPPQMITPDHTLHVQCVCPRWALAKSLVFRV
ncbi:hypothetical protein E1301_Tti019189 [Triplophysa tibetana]|uniref:HAT C-terminal dimerisation domain-containing protein n=1 Tax=Triplophysa tibetana TaxID=1572043 RepID=A0A5A9P7C3_9TELE|nr:hypothetical protein E1301_Tti019189 [Triplophysa tibetana]